MGRFVIAVVVVVVVVVVAGCGRVGFGTIAASETSPGDTRTPDVVAPLSCADASGRACVAGEICQHATVDYPDVTACCPGSQCLAIGGKQVATATPPSGTVTIDGVLTDWTSVPANTLTRKTIGTSAAADFVVLFSVQWDATALYVLFQVADDVCRPQDSVPPRVMAYNDDSVEVYLDMDPSNNTTAAYRPEEFWSWFPQNCGAGTTICGVSQPAAPLTTRLTSWVHPPPNNNIVAGTTGEATYMNNGAANCNWWVEIKVEWPAGSPTPVAGDVLGFDVAANDDDTGNRKNQLFWNDATGTLPNDGRKFGLLQLLPGP